VGEKYLLALQEAAGVAPLIVPALGDEVVDAALATAHGLFLTGSPSNVAPWRYADDGATAASDLDESRDRTAFALARAALRRRIPILAVCRGLQELNVVLGGTLHQEVQTVAGMRDHREPARDSMAERYAPAHRVIFSSGGVLQRIAGTTTATVNSLHGQGIDTLAPGAVIEAVAEDGLIEAFSLPQPGPWVLAVQWHPEWRALQEPLSRAIFSAFGQACREYVARPHGAADGHHAGAA
jgi:putative glutamine amidotransferase